MASPFSSIGCKTSFSGTVVSSSMVSAVSAMLIGFGKQELQITPTLHSTHEKGEAIDET
jgi:hypothetical protein